MKRTAFALSAAVLFTGLAGCGANEPGSAGAGGGPGKSEQLRVAAQSFSDAVLAANWIGMAGYFESTCKADNLGALALFGGGIKDTAQGHKMKVDSVEVVGDTGYVTAYSVPAGAPDGLRRLALDANSTSRDDPWHYVNGNWYAKCSSPPSGGGAVAAASPAQPIKAPRTAPPKRVAVSAPKAAPAPRQRVVPQPRAVPKPRPPVKPRPAPKRDWGLCTIVDGMKAADYKRIVLAWNAEPDIYRNGTYRGDFKVFALARFPHSQGYVAPAWCHELGGS